MSAAPPIPAPPNSNRGLTLRPLESLILTLIAGAIVWGSIHFAHPLFRVPKEFDIPNIGAPPELHVAFRREKNKLERWHAAIYLGCLGLLIGAALGLREGHRRRSWLPPLLAAPLGAVGGAIGGVLGCLVYERLGPNVGELGPTITAQLLAAIPLGLGIGLGLGLTMKSIGAVTKVALAGVAAGVLAGVIYSIAVSLLLPEASTDALLPAEASTRLLWLGILAGMIGLVIPLAGKQL
jgi:hypothetical protein